jgi:hypothetical protein
MKVYNTCDELPLSVYIACSIGEPLTRLITSLEPQEIADTELLRAAWLQIQTEFMQLSTGTLNTHAVELALSVDALTVKIEVVLSCLNMLETYFTPMLVEILQQHGFDLPLDPAEPETYYKNLNRISKRARSLLTELEDKAGQLRKLQPSEQPTVKINRQYFNKRLTVLSKFMGYEIKEETTSVSKYVSIMNTYEEHCKDILNARDGR